MSRIDAVFEKLKSDEKKAFVAFITAGDPTLDVTKTLCFMMEKSGVDIIELGVPFSDPLADGPTNQKAAERALASGTSLKGIFELVKTMRSEGLKTPIVLFSYLNPIFAMGYEAFAKACSESGVDGALVLDLPPEEASDYLGFMRASKIDTVFLASPTTSEKRLSLINQKSTGFVYYVSRTGVTGAKSDISETLDQEMITVRDHFTKPLVVGFGISNGDQARQISKMGDGIVIGSAIVKMLENYHNDSKTIDKMTDFVSGISKSLNQ